MATWNASPNGRQSERLTLLTYNVNWEVDPSSGIDAILQNNADIVCLQETNPRLQPRFEARLADRYPYSTFLHSRTRTGGGSAFFARCPGEVIAHVRSQTGWFDAMVARFDTAIGPLQVLNVHLRPAIDSRRERFALSAWLSTGPERLREIAHFCEPLDPQCATVIAGDFNEQRGSAVQWLRQRGYRSALQAHQPHATTWWWRWGPMKLGMRLDHIFHCGKLRSRTARVVRAGASDHWPVVAQLCAAAPTRTASPQPGPASQTLVATR